MHGFRLFQFSLMQLVANIGVALKFAWLWLLIGFATIFLIGLIGGPEAFSIETKPTSEQSAQEIGPAALLVAAIFVLSFIGGAAIAIGWHRFILRDEYPSSYYLMPKGGAIGSYIWGVLKVTFLIFVALIIFTLIMSVFVVPIFGEGLSPGNISSATILSFLIANLVITVLVNLLVLRVGLILPAIAMGESMTIGESFQLTAKLGSQLVVTAACVSVIQAIPTWIGFAFGGQSTSTLSIVLQVPFYALSFFISFSILTTLYGHLKENRAI